MHSEFDEIVIARARNGADAPYDQRTCQQYPWAAAARIRFLEETIKQSKNPPAASIENIPFDTKLTRPVAARLLGATSAEPNFVGAVEEAAALVIAGLEPAEDPTHSMAAGQPWWWVRKRQPKDEGWLPIETKPPNAFCEERGEYRSDDGHLWYFRPTHWRPAQV